MIEGVRFLVAACDHGVPFEAVVISERLLTAVLGQKLVRRLASRGVPVERVSPEGFRTLSTAERASGVIAVVRQRWSSLDAVLGVQRPWLAVGAVRSPGNLGTLLRTLAAIDGEGLIVLDRGTDPFDPRTVRATMGALFALRIVAATHAELARRKREIGWTVIGASPHATTDYREASYGSASVILVGAERHGLCAGEIALCDQLVRIPTAPHVDSLNAGVAGSLVLYETVRRRGSG